MHVMVIGGAGLPEQVAEAVRAGGDEVTVVQPVGERHAAADRAGVRYVTGDAAVPALLEAAGVRRADVLIACGRADEDNLVVSFLAKRRFAVPRVVAHVNDPANAWLFDESWGIDAAVSPSAALVGLVRQAPDSAGD